METVLEWVWILPGDQYGPRAQEADAADYLSADSAGIGAAGGLCHIDACHHGESRAQADNHIGPKTCRKMLFLSAIAKDAAEEHSEKEPDKYG